MSQEHMSQEEVRELLAGGHVGPRPVMRGGTLTEITVTIPVPPKCLHPNATKPITRGGIIGVHKAVKASREAACMSARAELLKLADWPATPQWVKATIHATFHLGPSSRRHDEQNLIGWLKASADGLQDAGVILNDSGLEWLPPSQVFTGNKRKVVLVIKAQ